MNLQNDFNKLDSKIQEVFENWDNKILPHPSDCRLCPWNLRYF